MTPSSSVSATTLPAAALAEAPKPQPVGGVHEWSTELDETEPYSLTASPSPLTPVSTTTTTTSSSSGSSTAEPPTREFTTNKAEAAASTHHRDEAEVKETAATAPRSGGALLLPRSAGGTPAVPPLSLSKLHSSKSAERGQSSSSPVAATNANATAPRSFYVPSFPPEAMLVSPRDSPSSFSATSSSSDACMPPRSAEEVYQDVMRGKRILVVEDNLINQKVALKMLSSFDCRVTVAENGLVAIKLFEESFRSRRGRHAADGEPLFHAILMDIQMPVIGTLSSFRPTMCAVCAACVEF